MATSDPYVLLGVSPETPNAEIKAAWRARVLASHPDKVQSRGVAAVEAAEAETKALNEAYSEIGRRRARAGGKKTTDSAYDRAAAPPLVARDAMHRARAALDFAESLVARWQRHVRAVRSALVDAQTAAQTATERGERLALLKQRSAMAKDTIEAAASMALDLRLVAPARRAAESAELVAQSDRSRPGVAAQLQRLVAEVEQALAPDPADLGAAIGAAREAAEAELTGLTEAVRRRAHLLRDAHSAAQRAKEANRTARRRLVEFERVVDLAAEIVERGVVLAGIAVGLAQVEFSAADAPHEADLAARARVEARGLRERAEGLYGAQEQATADAIRAREQLHETDGLARRAKQAAVDARADADVVAVGAMEAGTVAAAIGPAQLARVDATLRDLLRRTRLAAGS